MRVLIVYNPRSGRSRAKARANAAQEALERAGVHATLEPIASPTLTALAQSSPPPTPDALIVAGGDGTFTSLIPRAAALGVPLYHLPSGNENLYARQLGHTFRPADVLLALRQQRIARMDAMRVEHTAVHHDPHHSPTARLAGLMVTLGPDASVIDRLTRVSPQTRALGHLAYTLPVLAEMHEPHFPRVRVIVDGRVVVEGDTPGHLVIASSPAYALRIDPCSGASPFDGLLDVTFTAQGTPGEHLAWLIAHRLRAPWLMGARTSGTGGFSRSQGRVIEIEVLSGTAPVQMDGEQFAPTRSNRLHIEVLPGYFPVLLGPSISEALNPPLTAAPPQENPHTPFGGSEHVHGVRFARLC